MSVEAFQGQSCWPRVSVTVSPLPAHLRPICTVSATVLGGHLQHWGLWWRVKAWVHTSTAQARGAHGVSRGNVNTSRSRSCLSLPPLGARAAPAPFLPPMASHTLSVVTCSLERLVCWLDKEEIKGRFLSLFSKCFQMSHMPSVGIVWYRETGYGCSWGILFGDEIIIAVSGLDVSQWNYFSNVCAVGVA